MEKIQVINILLVFLFKKVSNKFVLEKWKDVRRFSLSAVA